MICRTDRHFCPAAFTLTEMLLVLVIVSMVTLIVLPAFTRQSGSTAATQARDLAMLLARARSDAAGGDASYCVEISRDSDRAVARIFMIVNGKKTALKENPLKLRQLNCYYQNDISPTGNQPLPFDIIFTASGAADDTCVHIGRDNKGSVVMVYRCGEIKMMSFEKLSAYKKTLKDAEQYWQDNHAVVLK